MLDELPEYMRTCYVTLFKFVGEVGYTTLKHEGRNIITTLTKSAILLPFLKKKEEVILLPSVLNFCIVSP